MDKNNYLICGLMVLILILLIVDICKKKKNNENKNETFYGGRKSGSVQEGFRAKRRKGCFTSNSILQTAKGSKYMKDLEIGDYILGHHNGKDKYVEIKGWITNEKYKSCEMLEITTENNNKLKMSEKHLIPRNTKYNYVYAEELKVGDTLFLTNNEKTKVKSIKLYKTTGFYSPYCSEGLIYVDGVLAHILSDKKNPEIFMPLYENLFNFYNKSTKSVEIIKNSIDTFKNFISPIF